MKTAELNDTLEFEGKLVQVVGIAIGKMIIMREVFPQTSCECGHLYHNTIYALENSPNFQNGAKAVQTIIDK